MDHDAAFNIAVTPQSEILTYRNPAPPETVTTRNGQDVLSLVDAIDGNYYEGHQDDYLIVDFGSQDTTRGAKLVLRTDPDRPYKWSIYVQILNSTGSWNTIASFIPRVYWSTDIIDLSAYLPDSEGDLKVRLYFTANHRIDYVGLDTTEQEEFEVHDANLAKAIHSLQGDVKETLVNSDDQYAELLPSERIILEFTAPQNTKDTRDFIIIMEGHYLPIS